MEPLRDTVVALTLSDGCSTDTQLSVEYLMAVAPILQNLMVAPTVTLVRPTGDTVVTQGYPSIPTGRNVTTPLLSYYLCYQWDHQEIL